MTQDKFDPYPYQERVTQLLLAGKNVILQAPTGAGKTAAAILPFIHASGYLAAEQFPHKCIYSVPMRILANQFKEEYSRLAKVAGLKDQLNVSIQTGDRPEDPKLESNLIFTTVDQTLSNFFNIPYALGRASANLNAGALISSYLIFDELHLYDPDIMLPSVLGMLRWLRGLTPFVLMTATFSRKMLERLANLLDAVVVPETDTERDDMQQVGTQFGKQRFFQPIDAPLNAHAVLNSEHQGKRVICICNTVERAQKLFADLKEELKKRHDNLTEACLIHSRFYRQDRNSKETWIREQFSVPQAKYNGPPLILVSTQVIEVGVNATCDVLHTELAPAASLLQRAGRCARFEKEAGHVLVYLPRNEQGEPDFTPYFLTSQPHKTERGKRLCETTWSALSEPRFQNIHINFTLEQDLIDAVHTPIDNEILDSVEYAARDWSEKALRAMRDQEQGLAPELIRNSPNRFVILHPNPETDENLSRDPWFYEGFALYPGTLSKAFNDLIKISSDVEAPWIMQQAIAIADRTNSEQLPARHQTTYKWIKVSEAKDVFSAIAVAVHPKLAQYDKEIGLRFGVSEKDEAHLYKRPGGRRISSYSYRRETYAEHISGLHRAYTKPFFDADAKRQCLPIRDEVACVLRKIEEELFFGTSVNLDNLIRSIFACHDIGKLSVDWQKWAHTWQEKVGAFYGGANMSLPQSYMAAHTDFDGSKEQKEAQRKLGKRPNHAGESAVAAAELLWSVCGEQKLLWQAAITAIARHHHAATDSYKPISYHRAAEPAFRDALQTIGLSQDGSQSVFAWTPDGREGLSPLLVEFTPANRKSVLIYLLFARILRIADQRSQAE